MKTEKIYQIFVSSTYQDLVEERKQVIQALLELDCIPVGMEMFPAANEDQWTLIKELIEDCDYYIVIIGGRYGSLYVDGIGYTQKEYEHANKIGIPTIAFLPENTDNIPAGKSEKDEKSQKKLEEFKKLLKEKHYKTWTNPDNLGSVVSRSLVQLMKSEPRQGWVRSGSVSKEEAVIEILQLKNEVMNLNLELAKSANQAPVESKDLSHGDDSVELRYQITGSSAYKSEYWSEEDEYDYGTVTVQSTWNEIFKALAPKMMNKSSEHILRAELLHFLQQAELNNRTEELRKLKFSNSLGYSLSSETFDLVMIQFLALGLIATIREGRLDKNGEIYWELTAYGRNVMIKLIAVKKSS